MQALSNPDLAPEEIIVSRDRSTLSWQEHGADRQDADRHVIDAERLRLSCRCAWCTRDRLTDRFPAAFSGVEIEGVAPIGAHALHITFSDGHARGVFPFRYLREIAREECAA